MIIGWGEPNNVVGRFTGVVVVVERVYGGSVVGHICSCYCSYCGDRDWDWIIRRRRKMISCEGSVGVIESGIFPRKIIVAYKGVPLFGLSVIRYQKIKECFCHK